VERLGDGAGDVLGLGDEELCLVIGMVIPEMSASWKPSVPIRLDAPAR